MYRPLFLILPTPICALPKQTHDVQQSLISQLLVCLATSFTLSTVMTSSPLVTSSEALCPLELK